MVSVTSAIGSGVATCMEGAIKYMSKLETFTLIFFISAIILVPVVAPTLAALRLRNYFPSNAAHLAFIAKAILVKWALLSALLLMLDSGRGGISAFDITSTLTVFCPFLAGELTGALAMVWGQSSGPFHKKAGSD